MGKVIGRLLISDQLTALTWKNHLIHEKHEKHENIQSDTKVIIHLPL